MRNHRLTRQVVRDLLTRERRSTGLREFGRDRPDGGFGNALLTRLPILAVEQWQLLWPPRLYDGSEPSEARSVLLARVQQMQAPFWAGITHLPRQDGQARTDALRCLRRSLRPEVRYARADDGVTIAWPVAGDGPVTIVVSGPRFEVRR